MAHSPKHTRRTAAQDLAAVSRETRPVKLNEGGELTQAGPDALLSQLFQRRSTPPAMLAQYAMPVGRAEGSPEEGETSTATKMLREVVPMDLRLFGSTLFGNREPITESNFSPKELAAMQQAIDKAVDRTGQAQKGSVQYVDYPHGEQIGPGHQPVGATLGRFVYEKQPDGTTVIRDRYDFYNEGRKKDVEAYEKMGRGERLGTVASRMLKSLFTLDPPAAMNELANAYIGREGREVTIKLPPKPGKGKNPGLSGQ